MPLRPSTRLKGKVAVVTGSTRGIGLLIAAALAQAGAHIVISSRSMAAVEAAYEKFEGVPGVQVLGVECDVRDLKQVEQLAARAVDRFGQIDIWFNNAGIAGPYARTGEIPPDEWRAVVETNLMGTYHGTYVALQHMVPRGAGKIINLLGAGDEDSRRTRFAYMSAYATSKAAVRRFTLAVAEEYRDTDLSILGFNPGLVKTDLTLHPKPLTQEAAERLKGFSAILDRFATPPEAVATMAVYLASRATDGETGRIYRLRPGFLALLIRWLTNR